MSGKQLLKVWSVAAVLFVAAALAGCSGASTTQAAAAASGIDAYKSEQLGTSYANALPASNQLILGTMKLEGTANAVTVEQAKALLPLWQAVEGGGLKSQEEIDAVLKQIEGTMTTDQLTAIAGMKLTTQDITTWMQQQGMNFRPPDGTPGPEGTYGPGFSGTPRAGFGPGFSGTPGPQQTERAARRATMEAAGITPGAGGGFRSGSSGLGQSSFLIRFLVELLAQRAGIVTPMPTP